MCCILLSSGKAQADAGGNALCKTLQISAHHMGNAFSPASLPKSPQAKLSVCSYWIVNTLEPKKGCMRGWSDDERSRKFSRCEHPRMREHRVSCRLRRKSGCTVRSSGPRLLQSTLRAGTTGPNGRLCCKNCRLVQYCSRDMLKLPCCSTQALVPSAVGGFLLGSLCVVGALVLAAWVRLRAAPLSCCTRCACVAATLCAHDAGSQLP